MRGKPVGENQWAVLAGLRFVLALLVLIGHEPMGSPDRWLLVGGQFGSFAAVCAFLAISGYSIAHSVQSQPVGFYGRRFRRIYPTHLAAMALCWVPFLLCGPVVVMPTHTLTAPPPGQVLASALMLQGFAAPAMIVDRPMWTLSVECFFYLLAPLLLRLRTRWLLALVAGSALAYAVYPFATTTGFSDENHGVAALCLGWAWTAGFVYYRNRETEWAKWLLAGGVVLLGYANLQEVRGTALVYFGSALLLIYGGGIALRPAAARVLNYLGAISFPLYLCHYPVLYVLTGRWHVRSSLALTAGCLLVAALVHQLVERPLAHYWRRADGRRAVRATPAL